MKYLVITKDPSCVDVHELLHENMLLKSTCNELVLRRPVYLGSDLSRKGKDIFKECHDPEDIRFQTVCKDEIVRFESSGVETVIYLNDKSRISTSAELSVLAGALRNFLFYLVSPGNLINLFYMERLTRSAARVILTNSEPLPVSAKAEIEILKLFDRTDLI